MIKKLNGNQIKMIAIIAMFMDHFATTLYPNYEKFWWLLLIHLIGRVAAPIMWFMVVEGYTHTHCLKKYLERLLIFSIIAHFAYNFCFGISLIPLKDSFLRINKYYLAIIFVCDWFMGRRSRMERRKEDWLYSNSLFIGISK